MYYLVKKKMWKTKFLFVDLQIPSNIQLTMIRKGDVHICEPFYFIFTW